MSLSRRRFIESASLTMLAAAARPMAFALKASGPKEDAFSAAKDDAVLFDVSEETFKPFIGERFAASKGGARIEYLTLLSIASAATAKPASRLPEGSRTSKPAGQAVKVFSLRFQTTGKTLPQGTYTLKNESLGSFPLFIVPRGPGADRRSYTATFSLLEP